MHTRMGGNRNIGSQISHSSIVWADVGSPGQQNVTAVTAGENKSHPSTWQVTTHLDYLECEKIRKGPNWSLNYGTYV